MRVLISGASGFIGSHLFARLASNGIDTLGLVRDAGVASTLSAQRTSQLTHITQFHRNAQVLSFANFDELNSGVAAFKPDVCIHLAGRSSVRESLQNPGLYAEANAAFSIELLEAARHAGCRRVIHASSVMVYGKDAPSPYAEEWIGSTPASFYGASKLAVEVLMNAWRALHGMESINLRLFSVYGPELRPDCVPHLIASAIRDERDFTVFGDGSSVRDYVEIGDVLNAIESAAEVAWRANFPAALNIGSGRGTSLLGLVRMIEQGLGKNARVVYKPAVAGELDAIVANVSRAGEHLNWKPAVQIENGIARLTEWFKGQKPALAK